MTKVRRLQDINQNVTVKRTKKSKAYNLQDENQNIKTINELYQKDKHVPKRRH